MDLLKTFAGRLILLVPMAFCIYLLLDSQDRVVRLFALVVLAILEQIREWLLVSSVRGLAKGNKTSQA